MDKNEHFVEDGETTKQSPETWPMGKTKQRRFQQKMSSLLSPATPKKNYTASHVKSLLLQCLRDSKSDPLPRGRRFPASYSDDGILMDGVLVTSATGKKVSDSPSSSLVRSSINRSQHKNSEFITSPRLKSGPNQGTTQSQHSSTGKRKMLENSPTTKVDTPKDVANPSKLQATAEPFIFTPRSSSQRPASPVPHQQLPYDTQSQCTTPPPHKHLSSSYGPNQYPPPSYAYPRPPPLYSHLAASPHGPDLYHTHYLFRSPGPIGYQMPHDFNHSPTITSLPTTPSSSQAKTNTSDPPVQTPISTNPTANLSSNTTIHGSGLDFSLPSYELETVTQKPDLSLPFCAGLQTMTIHKDWSPRDDGLETFSQAQSDFANSYGRILPDDVFEHYKYRKRLSVFSELCLDDKLP